MKKLLKAILIPLFLFSPLAAQSPSWSFEDTKEGWNSEALAKLYFHNSELQRQWAWELLGKIPLQGNEKILDFGCGDGKISAELSRLVFKGSVTGYDISAPLLKIANLKFPSYAYPNLKFEKTESVTFDDVEAKGEYDLVISCCVFHLLSKPQIVLQNLKKHLKPSGKIALLVPAGTNPLLFSTAEELFLEYGLKKPWADGAKANPMRTLDGAQKILKETGFAIEEAQLILTDTPFYDKEELITFLIGTLSANWNISPKLAPSFFKNLVEKMLQYDPSLLDAEGRVHYQGYRLHLIAHLE